ncbi:MAG: type II toxin-antitoxin system VapC family toxin [Marmoricola sp.]
MPVVDASVVVDWLMPGGGDATASERAMQQLLRAAPALSAPELLDQEVGNALLSGVRRGRWSGAAADEAFELLTLLPVRRFSALGDRRRAWHLSRRYDEHPLYDMVYVALAQRLGEPLITADERLVRRLTGHPAPVLTPEMFLS